MNGHEKILTLRMAGKKPPFVFMNDYPCKTNWFESQEHATVCTHGDSVESLDIRFLVGMAVSVSATTESRAKALFNACKQASASVVAACVVETNRHSSNQAGWCEVWRAS
jgi:hypothetical protein